MASVAGNKVKQTLQMILVIMLPIIALLGLTAVALTIRLDTASKASKAKSQLNNVLMVSEHFVLGLWGSGKESPCLIGFRAVLNLFRLQHPSSTKSFRCESFSFWLTSFPMSLIWKSSRSVVSLHVWFYFHLISWPSPCFFLISYPLCYQGRSTTFSITYTFFQVVMNSASTVPMSQFVNYAIQLRAIINSVLHVCPSLTVREVLPPDSIKESKYARDHSNWIFTRAFRHEQDVFDNIGIRGFPKW